jgi:hypothetical protein
MRHVMSFWEKTARLPFWQRLLFKIGIFGGILFLVLYPRPGLFLKQLQNYFQMDALIQTDFPELERINHEIDLLLQKAERTPRQEFLTVQSYVYRRIKYAYDWETWRNIDFWPTASQVWELQQEDCDGRAILAASILRSRGFQSAQLVGNMRHIWVKVDDIELMGPDTETMLRREGERLIVTLPSLKLLISTVTIYIADFPAIRHLILFFTLMILLYHPTKFHRIFRCNNNRTGRIFALKRLGASGYADRGYPPDSRFLGRTCLDLLRVRLCALFFRKICQGLRP